MLRRYIQFLLVTLCGLITIGCANPGSGPDGGPYDENPPRIVQLSPALGGTNEKAKKVTITFDELIKVENAQEKVTISPPQIEMADIKTAVLVWPCRTRLKRIRPIPLTLAMPLSIATRATHWATLRTISVRVRNLTRWRWQGTCSWRKTWNL